MSTGTTTAAPPAGAWDWAGRQRLVWVEARRRLLPPPAPATPASSTAAPRAADVPDWSDLLSPDRGGGGAPTAVDPDGRRDRGDVERGPRRDWTGLATRSDVMAALREDYPHDPAVRAAVDGAIADVAFLGRRGGPIEALGLRTPPRGLRWWWEHLGGSTPSTPPVPPIAPRTAAQLTLDDVLTGYGDPLPVA
jgi:hypothetical protein